MNDTRQSRQAFPGATLDAAGLNRQHVFDLAALPEAVRAALAPLAGECQLILIGHGGRRLWERVSAGGLQGADPIDEYTRHTIAAWFADRMPGRHFRLLYPGEQMLGLQQLGTLAGWHHPSPFMVGLDDEWGSWFAYRAVVLADTDFEPSAVAKRTAPCLSCQSKPCIAACPGDALDGGSFSQVRCADHRLQHGSSCEATCVARLACPVAVEHRYSDAQMRHSYRISLRMLARYRNDLASVVSDG